MGSRYSFTDDALANLRVFEVTPGKVWEALHSVAEAASPQCTETHDQFHDVIPRCGGGL